MSRLLAAGLAVIAITPAMPAGELKPIDFAKDIAPILEKHCIKCHHPDDARGDVSLSTGADLIEGEYVVAGHAAESELIALVKPRAGGKRPRMPKDGKPLTAEEVAAIGRWIDAGARWPKDMVIAPKPKADRSWWSLRPLADVTPPTPTDIPAPWQANPIDRFVIAELRDKGLSPSALADPRDLVRRLCYDLTGLPPTPEQVASFVADPSDEAYSRLVDDLLASPHYGERWGRHWLDVVRFGESNGFERNVIIDNAWPFRDYVIRSFNDDKPFDRLVKEHLAGDQLAPNDPTVAVGTTFLVCGPYDNVGNRDPVQAAVIRANTLDEITRAASEAFLGVTVGCARCHDHKFDPILQADYYRMTATFAGVTHGERVVATADSQKKHAATRTKLDKEKARLTADQNAIDAAIGKRTQELAGSLEKTWVRPAPDPFGTEEKFPPKEARYIRLTATARDDQPGAKVGFTIDEFEVWSAGDKSVNVALATAGATATGKSRVAEDFAGAYVAGQAIDGRFGGGWVAAEPTLTIKLARPTIVDRVVFSSNRATKPEDRKYRRPFVGEYRIEVSIDGERWKTVAHSADRKPVNDALRNRRLRAAAIRPDDQKRLAVLGRELAEVTRKRSEVPEPPRWWVGKFTAGAGPFHVFAGGDPQKKATEIVPASPSFLADAFDGYELTANSPEGERRLALANWITDRANPLTPRVLANRVWQYHFGTGIVSTPSDFGMMGGKPSHPALLDWLAGKLHEFDWRLKPMHRLIVTSQAYRQSSDFRPKAAAIDGDSRLLWRFPPRRLSAEEVRDSMLAVAGKLDPKMGGPGFRLYRYLQDNVATYVPLDDPGPETYRRAVYHQNARAAPVDVLADFDCPDPAFASPRRASTTTPIQALALFNHQFTLDMAAAFASRLEAEAGTEVASQVRKAFILAYGRPANAQEIAASRELIREHGLRAFCRAVLNSNEFLYLD